jgi:uncharacterized phage infection (PIP) family protein YhgE
MENSDQTPKNPEAGTEGPKATEQPGQELLDELTQLADKFATVVRSAWNSEQRKQVEADVRSGLSTMAVSIEDGLKQVASSNEAKDLQTKATEVGDKVTSTKFFADLTGALTTGLRALSDQLDKVSQDLQAKNAATGATPPPPPAEDVKDIPISKE